MKTFKDKIVLVTGGTGSIGSELVSQILKYNPRRILIFSRDETKQQDLINRLSSPPNIRPLIGDIRDKDRLLFALKGVDIVLHAAAMKHVPICEYNPTEAIKTNIEGSRNVIEASIERGVKKVIAISTDKAVNPSNVMGISKLMMEKLFINSNYYIKNAATQFACVRFGNVAWSRGSVLPTWKSQAEEFGEISLTDPDMTRFFISRSQAIKLVLEAASVAQGGEIFVLKMPSIKIKDLADLFIKKYFPTVKIKTIGSREGEKKHEELGSSSDQYRSVFTDGKMYILIPREGLISLLNSNDHDYWSNYQVRGFTEVKDWNSSCSSNSINIEEVSKII